MFLLQYQKATQNLEFAIEFQYCILHRCIYWACKSNKHLLFKFIYNTCKMKTVLYFQESFGTDDSVTDVTFLISTDKGYDHTAIIRKFFTPGKEKYCPEVTECGVHLNLFTNFQWTHKPSVI